MMAARLGQQTRATVAVGLSRRRRGTAASATDSATKQELGARPKPGWDNASMDGAWSADAQRILNDLQEKVTARDLPALLQLFEILPFSSAPPATDVRQRRARHIWRR